MLKKQTVWLLTMLSLMIVLSVYYMMSPNDGDLAFVNNGETNSDETVTGDAANDSEDSTVEGEAGVDDISNVGQDELFAMQRLEIQDKRSIDKSRLEDIVTSGSASIEEKDEALKGIDVIEETTMKEDILEGSIAAAAGYEDVLVRTLDENKVQVHVKVDELSSKEANDIMQMVRDEFGVDTKVEVNFQPTGSE